MDPNDADEMANSVDLDQRSSLIWVCTVCPGLSVQKLRIITVFEDCYCVCTKDAALFGHDLHYA